MPIVVGDEFLPDPRWDLYIADSETLTTIGPLYDASSLSLDLALNRPGRMQFRYPLDGEFAGEFSPINRCVILVYEGQMFWSGMILSFNQALPDEALNVVAVGWLETLYHRKTRAQISYVNQTRGTIIHDLLAVANAQHATWISQGVNTDSAPVLDKTFETDAIIGQGIEEMTSIEAGPDISVDPEFRTLDIQSWDQYVNRTSVIWGYSWGPENVESFSRNIDGEALINRITVYGKNNTITPYLTEDTVSQNAYQLFETSVTLSGVGETDILAAFGEAELIYKRNPRVTYQFQPVAGNDQPLIFRDFNLGDKCYLKARYGNLFSVDQAIRVFSCSLQIDENGIPKMTNMVTVAA